MQKCVPRALLRGEDTLAGRRGGWGVNILEDERNRMPSYNDLSTYETNSKARIQRKNSNYHLALCVYQLEGMENVWLWYVPFYERIF
jgi:hypothetical protein